MTGTSLDGVDVCLLNLPEPGVFHLLETCDYPLPERLSNQVRDITHGINDGLKQIAQLDIELANCYAEAVDELLHKARRAHDEVRAIGSHGQTVKHCPDEKPPYTVQLGNGHHLAERTGITTVTDFRVRDMAAGGQGAPLAPAFHQMCFGQPGQTVVVLNLGGIANISILDADSSVTGFDTGPANVLMDCWISTHKGEPFDRDGAWAASGRVDVDLLDKLLEEPWLQRTPPKSTGPERFNKHWLDTHLTGLDISAEDVQRTLCEFTAVTVADHILNYAPKAERLIVCGGGACNPFLLQRLSVCLPEIALKTTDQYGLAPEWVESAMFAWLAHRTLHNLPGNVPAVTGAKHPCVLGAIHSGARR